MGSNVASSYANIFMGKFEEKFIYGIYKMATYIDDVFVIWKGPRLSFFIGKLTRHAHISSLLYILIHRRFLSLIPEYMWLIKTSLPKSQFTRVRWIVSDDNLSQVRMDEMTEKFLSRHYPSTVVHRQRGEVEKVERDKLLKKRERENNLIIPFISMYNTLSDNISKIIRKHWDILKTNLGEIPAFQNPPVMSYKKAHTIGSMLVKADIGPGKENRQTILRLVKKGTFACCSCNFCNNIQKGEVIYHPRSTIPVPISGHYSCTTTFVVYAVKCPCGLVYVGQTSRMARYRIREHKSAIKCKRLDQPVAKHFAETGHAVQQ
ncbi:hypothetical protein XELAEV_18037458mg [Xenopus laevis]|uniref:GIY-YIG domain-containing protein n=1 Tax=Xenopus laevis TaxID=8355 RepID=A0A974HAF6_XENLA|nr:hypothetical protein XELAEV_18037458mg [Xenopus laevis]